MDVSGGLLRMVLAVYRQLKLQLNDFITNNVDKYLNKAITFLKGKFSLNIQINGIIIPVLINRFNNKSNMILICCF